VKSIGSRLTDGDGKPMPNMGSTLAFSSGLSFVDYETPKVVELQSVGDKVQVCLVALPKNCPKGGDRGKLDRVFDYRQKASYEMGDSQHMCGGAFHPPYLNSNRLTPSHPSGGRARNASQRRTYSPTDPSSGSSA
jgi:hypothetical protein